MSRQTMARERASRNPEELAAKIAPHIAAILSLLIAPASTPDDLVPLAEAAHAAATTVRVLRDAIRAGELPAVGKQRDRAIRRADLLAWIESRRVVHAPIDDRDIDRRVARLRKVG